LRFYRKAHRGQPALIVRTGEGAAFGNALVLQRGDPACEHPARLKPQWHATVLVSELCCAPSATPGPFPKADLGAPDAAVHANRVDHRQPFARRWFIENKNVFAAKLVKPSVPLSINADGASALAFKSVDEAEKWVVSDFLGQMRHQWEHTYDYPNPEVVLPKIQEALALMQSNLGQAWPRCVGIPPKPPWPRTNG
jgi:hypothetical protein